MPGKSKPIGYTSKMETNIACFVVVLLFFAELICASALWYNTAWLQLSSLCVLLWVVWESLFCKEEVLIDNWRTDLTMTRSCYMPALAHDFDCAILNPSLLQSCNFFGWFSKQISDGEWSYCWYISKVARVCTCAKANITVFFQPSKQSGTPSYTLNWFCDLVCKSKCS